MIDMADLDVQLMYKLVLVLLYGFFATMWTTPVVLQYLVKYKYTVKDVYKKSSKLIPTMGGIGIMMGVMVALSLSQILISELDLGRLFIFYFIALVYAFYGLVDDIFMFKKRYDKIIIVLVLSFPIASLITDTSLDVFGFVLNLGSFYSLIIAPVFIMVVANLINLHSGYNGLVTGNSLLIMIFLAIRSFMQDGLTNLLFILPVMGALAAFYPYNRFPARALEGNVGAFFMGGAIGCFIIGANLEWYGIFILIPHIINFIMDTWTFVVQKRKDVKYGKIRSDETIEAPPTMKYKSLKFLLVSWFRLTEKQATYILYVPTIVLGIIGLLIF